MHVCALNFSLDRHPLTPNGDLDQTEARALRPAPASVERLRLLAPRQAAHCSFPTPYVHEGIESPGNKEHCSIVIGGPEKAGRGADACRRGEVRRRIELPP